MSAKLLPDEIRAAQFEGQALATRACCTCRHVGRSGFEMTCRATGTYCSIERNYTNSACGQSGKLWEPRPARRAGLIEKAWRVLFGYRP